MYRMARLWLVPISLWAIGLINLDIAVEPSTNLVKITKNYRSSWCKVAADKSLRILSLKHHDLYASVMFTGNSIVVKVMGKTNRGKQLENKK